LASEIQYKIFFMKMIYFFALFFAHIFL
jgi:hypothetical protein